MKKAFKHFYQEQFTQQQPSATLYAELQHKLFVRSTVTSQNFWQRLQRKSVWPITIGLVGSLAVVAVLFVTVKDQVIDPKAALAQSLEYTFGKDTFWQSFGLGNPDDFKHRTIVVTVPHRTPMPIPDASRKIAIDPSIDATFTSTLNIWQYQGSARIDITTSDPLAPFPYDQNSYLLSKSEHRSCDGNTRKIHCQSIAELVKQRRLKPFLQDKSIEQYFIEGLYEDYITPIWLLSEHFEDFAEPIEQAQEIKNNHNATRLRFVLPVSYQEAVHIYGGYSDRNRTEAIPTYIDVWFDPVSNQIVGYTLLDQTKDTMQAVDITTDEIVTDAEPERFFSKEYWQQAITATLSSSDTK